MTATEILRRDVVEAVMSLPESALHYIRQEIKSLYAQANTPDGSYRSLVDANPDIKSELPTDEELFDAGLLEAPLDVQEISRTYLRA